MSDKQFISNLSATYADVRKLDVKKINLKGKNILEYISESKTVVKHSHDTRETVTEDDLWGQWIETLDDGTVIIHDDQVTNPGNGMMDTWNENITKVENNKAYVGEDLFANIQTDKIVNGTQFFYYNALESFSSDLSSLTNGECMFAGCRNLTTFTADSSGTPVNLSSLTEGSYMFCYCEKLESFTSDLSSLEDGHWMFHCCSNLETFTSDLSSLTDGSYMFNNCKNLTTFTSNSSGSPVNLSSLTDGSWMFASCWNLTTFNSDLSSLTNGNYMFAYSDGFESFTSDLSSLTNGSLMFHTCILDATSVSNIIHFIPQRDAKPTTDEASEGIGVITIGIGISDSDAEKQAFAEECFCDSWQDLLDEFDAKNWNTYWQFNGTSTTYSLRQPSTAVYTKLEEVFMPTEEEIEQAKKNKERIKKPHYRYTSQDGTRFYNIHWYHESNTENDDYTLFDSLDAAIEAYGLIPKE